MQGITLEGLIRQYTTNSINHLFTSIPARVVSANLAEQRVDVEILVSKVTTDDVSRKHPLLLNVPLVFPGSRSSQFSFPVNSGDTVLLVFSQRSIDRFKLGATTAHTPTDFRKYSKNDAMAIPGLFSFPDAVNNPSKRSLSHSTADTVVVHNIGTGSECEVRLKASGDIIINSPGKVEVNCQTSVVNAQSSSTVNTQSATINASSSTTINSPDTTVTGNMLVQGHLTFVSGMTGSGGSGGAVVQINGSLQTTGNVSANGDVTAGSVSLMNHTHPGDSGGTTGKPNS